MKKYFTLKNLYIAIAVVIAVSILFFSNNTEVEKNIGKIVSSESIATDITNNRSRVTMATALDDVNDSITVYPKSSYVNISTSTLIKTGAGQIYGVIINSHTSGTAKFWDNTSAATTVLANTMTFSAVATTGERFIPFFGATFGTGLYITTTGTVDLTILYR